MSEEEYAAADKRYWAAYEELVDVKRRAEDFPLASSLRAVAIHRRNWRRIKRSSGRFCRCRRLILAQAHPTLQAHHIPVASSMRLRYR